MIILEKPYVSDFLIETIKKNHFDVLNNETARKYFSQSELVEQTLAIEKYLKNNELFYSNSENSINWISENLKNSALSEMIALSKDKFAFREILKGIYPNYYFEKIKYSDLGNFKPKKYPVILKPCVGFLSFGVYPINNETEWQNVIEKIDCDIEKLKGIFPLDVVNLSDFLIEEMIEGDEYALDAYFDEKGEATILNIYQHPFFNDKDVSDRAYFTSSAIIKKYLNVFKQILDKIGKIGNYKNFPFHLELRANEKEIIPIELNPMRFCGWCITDLAYFAWNINVYEAFFNKIKPNWEEILKNAKDDYFYFTIADIPNSIDKKEIKDIDYNAYLKNIKNPLEIRKIDYKNNPIFAIVFASTPNMDEIKRLLEMSMEEFVIK